MLSDNDINLLAFTQTLELTTRDLYLTVVGLKTLSEDEGTLLAQFHSHHVAYEQSLNGLLSKNAATARNETVFADFATRLSTSSTPWATLQEIENTLVATHAKTIESIESAKVAALIASIITVEARQAAILATLTTSNLSAALDNNAIVLVAS